MKKDEYFQKTEFRRFKVKHLHSILSSHLQDTDGIWQQSTIFRMENNSSPGCPVCFAAHENAII